jgi:hypothetical protein
MSLISFWISVWLVFLLQSILLLCATIINPYIKQLNTDLVSLYSLP